MNKINKKIKNILDSLPNKPGVYLFYAKKRLVYVGKATAIKTRVKSYFSKLSNVRPIELMMHEIDDIEYELTDSVLEAVILEAKMIKKFKPKYNIVGRDNKSWNYLIVTKDDFPKLIALRQYDFVQSREKKDYLKVFGPFPGLNSKEAIKLLSRLFNISKCKVSSGRSCFDYQLGVCLGVCLGQITKKEYAAKVIKPLILFLSGNKKRLILNLERDMKLMAGKKRFEEAARLKKQIAALKKIRDISMINKSFFEEERQSGAIQRIEAYDISNLGATTKVGSRVVFNLDGPCKKEYRLFKIKRVWGQSDTDCLAEVVQRRFSHQEWLRPDLVLVDGGQAQVNVVRAVLMLNKINLPILGIAKGRTRKKNEFIFDKQNLWLKDWAEQNKDLLLMARDEAHYLAVKYQRKLSRQRLKNVVD